MAVLPEKFMATAPAVSEVEAQDAPASNIGEALLLNRRTTAVSVDEHG